MKQQQTFRGFMFIILMLILLMLALRFPYARQAQTVTAQEFEQILGSGNVAEAVISPNPPDTKRICDSYTGKWPDSPPERI